MKNIKYIVYGFSGIFVLGLLFLAFAFSTSSIKKLSSGGVKTEIQKLKTGEMEFVSLKQSFRDWQRVAKAFNRFKSDYLLPFSEFSGFRNRFEMLLRNSGVNHARLVYNISNVNRKIVKVAIGFEAAAGYQNLRKMIHEIEQMKPIIYIDVLKMAKSPSGLKADVGVEVYFVR